MSERHPLKYLFGATAVCLMATAACADTSEQSVTVIADVQRGSMVTVAGTVDRILKEDEFRLSDGTGTVRVYVGPNWVPVNVGEEISVFGLMDDALSRPELYAREITRVDGTIVELSHRYE